jgi:outer membrane protein
VVKSVLWGAAAALALATSPVWAELKVGYVNYGQLLQESPQAKAIAESIRQEFMPRQRELVNEQQTLKTRADKFQRDQATMSDDQRDRTEKELRDSDRDLQRKQSELQDDFNARRNEELSRLQRSLIQEVQTYAKAQNFDLVLAEGVIYANNSIDITPAILTRLKDAAQRTGGTAAPAKTGKSGPSK